MKAEIRKRKRIGRAKPRRENELGKEKERVTKDGPCWHSASSRPDILYLAVDNQSAGFYLDPAIPFLLAFPRTTMLIVAAAHNLVLRRLSISPPPCYAAPATEYQNHVRYLSNKRGN